MTSGIYLDTGSLSSDMFSTLQRYYRNLNVDPEYIEGKWRQWEQTPALTVYMARKNNEVVGWLIYNRHKSTIEEFQLTGDHIEDGIESQIVDALVNNENLIAAEVLSIDRDKYQWMVEYGFRPISFTAGNFSQIKLELSTAVLIEKLDKLKSARSYSKTETVCIEKVPATQTYSEVKDGLANLIARLGGLDKFVKKGQSVVIKPNIVSDHGLKDGVYTGGVVTDIRLIKALVEILLPVAGKVIIAEGSSINRSETRHQFMHYGYDSIVNLDPDKISLVDLNNDELVEKAVPGAKRMTSRKIPLTLDKADVIISVPVMKTHFAAVVSLSIKNLQGAVPPLEKYMSHFFGLWQNLVNINHIIKPQLIIIDGLTGQEGFGPLSGTPKQMDVLIGGTNPVAVDSVAMRIMGIAPVTSPPVRLAYLQGLGPIEDDKIEIIGPSIDEVASPFIQPEFNLSNGRDINIHVGNPCQGCRAYFHFTLSKLRRPDPRDKTRQLIDRPFEKAVNIFLGPETPCEINPDETNIFMGICQQHHAQMGKHVPGCPPHTEAIIESVFGLFPDVQKAKYADKNEESRLGEMLQEILNMPRRKEA
ncbi:MAG: DUF362 domain-containing protein [Chitinophagales bacterium]